MPFHVKPLHLWTYLNPAWWRTKKTMEAMLKHEWENKGLKEKTEKAITHAMLYGEGSAEVDWK